MILVATRKSCNELLACAKGATYNALKKSKHPGNEEDPTDVSARIMEMLDIKQPGGSTGLVGL